MIPMLVIVRIVRFRAPVRSLVLGSAIVCSRIFWMARLVGGVGLVRMYVSSSSLSLSLSFFLPLPPHLFYLSLSLAGDFRHK